jgi:hypothetical protein
MSNGTAISRLIVFLKTKIIPVHKSLAADKLFRHHAMMILGKLNISPDATLSDFDIHAILEELELYPDDYTRKNA